MYNDSTNVLGLVLFPKRTGTDSLIQIQCEDKAGHSTYTNNVKEIDVTQVTCNTNAIRKKKMWFVTLVLSSTGMLYNIACGISKQIKIKII